MERINISGLLHGEIYFIEVFGVLKISDAEEWNMLCNVKNDEDRNRLYEYYREGMLDWCELVDAAVFLRERMGLTVEKVAEMSCINQEIIRRMEEYHYLPYINVFLQVLHVYGKRLSLVDKIGSSDI